MSFEEDTLCYYPGIDGKIQEEQDLSGGQKNWAVNIERCS
jgi:hypothetical protein